MARCDFLLLPALHAETDLPEVPTFRLLTECSGTQCALTHSLTSASSTFALSDLEAVDLPTEAVGAKYGITLM